MAVVLDVPVVGRMGICGAVENDGKAESLMLNSGRVIVGWSKPMPVVKPSGDDDGLVALLATRRDGRQFPVVMTEEAAHLLMRLMVDSHHDPVAEAAVLKRGDS